MRSTSVLFSLLLSVAGVNLALAQAPDSLSFQGLLTKTDGTPVDSSAVSMTFTLYKGAAPVWFETQVVDVQDGIYNVLLGSVTPMDTVRFNQAIDLGVKLDGEPAEMSPRTPLAAAAYAKALPGLYTFFHQQGTSESYNVVGGANNNSVGSNVTGATISGGGGIAFGNAGPNKVLASFGVIGGGEGNTVSDRWSTIGGGVNNSTSGGEMATIGGGWSNTVSGDQSVVAGGRNNTASGDKSFVGGGRQNTSDGDHATVLGGENNEALAKYSTVVGGANNSATGNYSSVLGGQWNVAGANFTVALGYRANAEHKGSFVWQDTSGTQSLTTTAPNQFLARASGGVTFYTNAAPSTSAGVTLGPGLGAWAPVSDVNAKTAFGQPDPQDVLEKLSTVAIQTWRYREEDASNVHIGPTAQDFYQTFGYGIDDKHIVTVDADGVALAAIQGLYELVKEQQAEIERLKELMIDD